MMQDQFLALKVGDLRCERCGRWAPVLHSCQLLMVCAVCKEALERAAADTEEYLGT